MLLITESILSMSVPGSGPPSLLDTCTSTSHVSSDQDHVSQVSLKFNNNNTWGLSAVTLTDDLHWQLSDRTNIIRLIAVNWLFHYQLISLCYTLIVNHLFTIWLFSQLVSRDHCGGTCNVSVILDYNLFYSCYEY